MDVIVTGLPRSGLTAVAALIDGLPNAVCLNMPVRQVDYARDTADITPLSFSRWLVDDFTHIRECMLAQVPVTDFRTKDGLPLLDSVYDPRLQNPSTNQEKLLSFVRAGLKEHFTLAMKHHALYTGILPEIIARNHFTIIAVIRHPLDVIASWKRWTAHPLSQGKMPFISRFWRQVAQISASKTTVLERMVQLYDAHMERYHVLRDRIHILPYEEIVHNPRIVSNALGMSSLSANAGMLSRQPRIHRNDEAEEIRAYLKQYGVFSKHYYPNI